MCPTIEQSERAGKPALSAPVITTLPKIRVGGVVVGRLSREQWAEHLIQQCLKQRQAQPKTPKLYTSANGHVLSRYARSAAFRAQFERFDGVDADGMPLVVASRWFTNSPIPERCATTDFFHDLASQCVEHGLSMYFLGGEIELQERLIANVRQRYPNLKIAGHWNGYFSRKQEQTVLADINSSAPDVLWVGLGVPKEHDFVLRNYESLRSVGIVKTCGGLFDFLSGKNARAPEWMQYWSLEWLFRTIQEPRRLLFRYLTTNVHTCWLLVSQTSDQT